MVQQFLKALSTSQQLIGGQCIRAPNEIWFTALKGFAAKMESKNSRALSAHIFFKISETDSDLMIGISCTLHWHKQVTMTGKAYAELRNNLVCFFWVKVRVYLVKLSNWTQTMWSNRTKCIKWEGYEQEANLYLWGVGRTKFPGNI